MLVGNTGTPNLVLLLAGLLLIAAGVAAVYFREGVADYLRDLREQIFGEPRTPREPGRPIFPIVAGVVIGIFGLIGVYGGLFGEITPRT